ncbi:glycosyltransferase [Terrimonas sp. NA20]|uniref:Glycosyltransferase n=1 Tax=Terrimonas ginsenosidimutans TaxID=2908004 RepID=A0ABS9L0H1_9BACT|nr:glycosyltransferase [Terrimonas ginsenosidimutans]MCG2618078.1 glycosyltransferase [Terrimonas ginsenosidimutans]
MKKSITFVTLGNIETIATMKRALGMAYPLHKEGWNVSIIAMDCFENRKRISLECGNDVTVRYYKESSANDEVAQKTALIRELKPSHIYFCSFSVRNRIIKNKLGYKPFIIIEHSELQSGIKDLSFPQKIKAHLMEYGSVIYADGLVCASTFLVKEYRKYAKKLFKRKMPISYSPYAFNNDVVSAPKIILEELEEKYRGKDVFLYMGTMTRNYGLFAMLDAMKNNRAQYPEARLLLMGKGRHYQEGIAYAEKNNLTNIVDFLGYVPEEEISSYFELADAFISPLNNTVQDIARCPSKIYMYLPFKKPVFTSKIGEPAEIFGENGFYFDTSKPESLSVLMMQKKEGKLREPDINIDEHSWHQRTIDFNNWINSL